MEIPAIPIESYAKQGTRWLRFGWSAVADPDDTLEAVLIGKTTATVTVHIAETPEGAKLRWQRSPDGKKGWTDLDTEPAAFFRHKPGDVIAWNGLTGFLRPVLETSKHGRLSINVTIAPHDRQHRITGECVYDRSAAG